LLAASILFTKRAVVDKQPFEAAKAFAVTGSLLGLMSLNRFQNRAQIPAATEQHEPSRAARKMDNVQIFHQTCDTFNRGHYQTPTGRTIRLYGWLQAKMERNSQVYSSIPPLRRHPQPRFRTQITVENLSTLRMTEKLLKQGLNPLVLDMANRYSAGGGVRSGANAQEEILCRQSNLMKALLFLEQKNKYPIPELGGIYIPGVQFFRADPKEGYAYLEKPLTASIFASAAYDCGSDRPADEMIYRQNTKEKIRTMLRAALIHGHDSIVLSAFGCGAFHNNPQLIATLYREVFAEAEFQGQFKKIAFGIIEDHNSSGNFSKFKQIFA